MWRPGASFYYARSAREFEAAQKNIETSGRPPVHENVSYEGSLAGYAAFARVIRVVYTFVRDVTHEPDTEPA